MALVQPTVINGALREAEKIQAKSTDMLVLLITAPDSISHMAEMIAFSTQTRITLTPRPGARHFSVATELRASLLTIANSSLAAFNESQVKLLEISSFVEQTPEKIMNITKALLDADQPAEIDFAKVDANSVLEDTKRITVMAKGVYELFNTVTEQVHELMAAVTYVSSKSDEVIKHNKAQEIALVNFNRLVEHREAACKLKLQEATQRQEQIESGDVSAVAYDETATDAEFFKTVLVDNLDIILDCFSGDGQPDPSKLWGDHGTLYVLHLLRVVHRSFVGIQSTTISTLYDEVQKAVHDICQPSFNTEGVKARLEELRTKAAEWNNARLSADEIKPPHTECVTEVSDSSPESVKAILSNSFQTLASFRNTWGNLVMFFSDLATHLETSLTTSIISFIAKTKTVSGDKKPSQIAKNLVVSQALQICRVAFEAHLATSTYDKVYRTYLGPNLQDVGKLLGLRDQAEITQLKHDLVDTCGVASQGVRELTKQIGEKTKEEYTQFVRAVCPSD